MSEMRVNNANNNPQYNTLKVIKLLFIYELENLFICGLSVSLHNYSFNIKIYVMCLFVCLL